MLSSAQILIERLVARIRSDYSPASNARRQSCGREAKANVCRHQELGELGVIWDSTGFVCQCAAVSSLTN